MPIPEPPTELTAKYRWVQCTIKNETQFPITLLSGAYLPSDTFWPAQPGDCAPFDQLVFSTYNDDRTNPAQANGAVFLLTLDHQDYASFYKVALVAIDPLFMRKKPALTHQCFACRVGRLQVPGWRARPVSSSPAIPSPPPTLSGRTARQSPPL